MDKKFSENHKGVIIIGGGPTGLSLGLGLSKHGVKSIILEEKEELSRHSRAPVIHQRTREIFRLWGVEKEFLKEGNLIQKLTVCKAESGRSLFSLNFKHLSKEAHNPGMLLLEQFKTEEILLDAVRKSLFCEFRFSSEAVKLEQSKSGVTVWYRSNGKEYSLTAEFVVGCDGASSFVRDWLDLPFEGKTYNVRTVLADVRPGDSRNELAWPRLHSGKKEITVGIKIASGLWRLIHLESSVGSEEEMEREPSTAEIDEWVGQVLGKGKYEQVWASPFNIHRRSSPSFRKGRIFLAGDAAHIHSPVGGQGMNAGIQDAHNLAWKLSAVLKNEAGENLLGSYEKERMQAVVEEVSGNTDFITKTFLQSPKFFRTAAFFFLRRILTLPPLRNKFLRRAAMINIGYKDSIEDIPGNRAGGKRLPNTLLYPKSGKPIRIYDKLSGETVIVTVHYKMQASGPYKVIPINEKLEDKSGLLKKLIPGGRGWIIVRPDTHILRTGKGREELRRVLENWGT
jgi:2-polyprenyl-6-methoxyphenol hydroxylase-like FAD-dependent oxidoreductase